MSRRTDLDIVTGSRSPIRPGTGTAPPSANDSRDPCRQTGGITLPLTGQPGHGQTASLRRQPVRIVYGRIEGGYSDVFELICPSCGDYPYLDYSEVPPELQRIRGPYPLEAGLAAYEEHLTLSEQQHRRAPGRGR